MIVAQSRILYIYIKLNLQTRKAKQKTYKKTKDSTFIISQILMMNLHNTFNACRL